MSGPDNTGQANLCASFRENEPALIRFIASRIGCRATAEDIAQEVFLRIRRASADVDNPRALLFTIARNLATNYKIQRRRRTELTSEVQDLLWSGIDETTPERHLAGIEDLERVASVLEQLPERTRNILYWRRFEGLNRTEIAAKLGISYQAVEKHLQKAVALLADAITPPK